MARPTSQFPRQLQASLPQFHGPNRIIEARQCRIICRADRRVDWLARSFDGYSFEVVEANSSLTPTLSSYFYLEKKRAGSCPPAPENTACSESRSGP